MSCQICGKISKNRLCADHERAYQNLAATFKAWQGALGTSWEDYLKAVGKNPNSGIWVREVCVFLLRN